MIELMLDEAYTRRAPQVIGTAKRSIDVSLYKAVVNGKNAKKSSRIMLDRLLIAARQNVTVRVLLNTASPAVHLRQQNRIAAQWMKEHGIQVRHLTAQRCNHAKFLVVDDSYAIVGSHNWSFDSLRRNHEASLGTDDPYVIEQLHKNFNHLWSTATKFAPLKSSTTSKKEV